MSNFREAFTRYHYHPNPDGSLDHCWLVCWGPRIDTVLCIVHTLEENLHTQCVPLIGRKTCWHPANIQKYMGGFLAVHSGCDCHGFSAFSGRKRPHPRLPRKEGGSWVLVPSSWADSSWKSIHHLSTLMRIPTLGLWVPAKQRHYYWHHLYFIPNTLLPIGGTRPDTSS